MLLLKKAPRICSTTAADCYQYISAVLFLRFHTRNGLYKVCEQGNRTSIIFNCLKLVPGAGSWYMSRPGLTWLGFAVVKPVFSGLMQVLGSLDVISSDKITWIIAAWQKISPSVPKFTMAKEKSNNTLWVNMGKLQLGIIEEKKKTHKGGSRLLRLCLKGILWTQDWGEWCQLGSFGADRKAGQALVEATSEIPPTLQHWPGSVVAFSEYVSATKQHQNYLCFISSTSVTDRR